MRYHASGAVFVSLLSGCWVWAGVRHDMTGQDNTGHRIETGCAGMREVVVWKKKGWGMVLRKTPGAQPRTVRIMLSVRSFLPVLMYATPGGHRQARQTRRMSAKAWRTVIVILGGDGYA